jgi:hypothetical protein
MVDFRRLADDAFSVVLLSGPHHYINSRSDLNAFDQVISLER